MASLPPMLKDVIDRVGWTFVQALAGSVVSAGTAATLTTFDYRSALAGGGAAALLCLLKVLAVSASTPDAPPSPPAPPAAPAAVNAPSPAPVSFTTPMLGNSTFTFSPAPIRLGAGAESPAEQTAVLPVIEPAPPVVLSAGELAALSADRGA